VCAYICIYVCGVGVRICMCARAHKHFGINTNCAHNYIHTSDFGDLISG